MGRPTYAWVLVLCLVGCGDDEPRDLPWEIVIPPTISGSVVLVEARILDGTCDRLGTPLSTSLFPVSDGASTMLPPDLPPGDYAFEAIARNELCVLIARGCVNAPLPVAADAVLRVELDPRGPPSPACPEDECAAGRCDSDVRDAGVDSGRRDAGEVDAGDDAGDEGCPVGFGDCDGEDDNGCETDLSTATDCGSCGAACTSGCVAGVCPPAATAVCAGSAFSCAVVDGEVLCWGLNDVGQLGVPPSVDRPMPMPVPGIVATDVKCGADFACALREDGRVSCWGSDAEGQLGDGTMVTPCSEVCGLTAVTSLGIGPLARHACAIDAAGLHCWGDNERGQIGDGNRSADARSPSSIPLTDPRQVDTGAEFTCAIAAAGTFCWGDDGDGQVGNGAVSGGPRDTPQPVMGVPRPVQVATGAIHACLRTAGQLHCWGNPGPGISGSDSPFMFTTMHTDLIDFSAGEDYTCYVRAGGTVHCFGANANGQLGNAGSMMMNSPTPIRVDGITNAVEVVAGAAPGHTCALLADGTVWCWGANASGQLGDGTRAGRATPMPVVGVP